MCYGVDVADQVSARSLLHRPILTWREAGLTCRFRPPTKFELVINLTDRQGARPRPCRRRLLASADEVIE